MIRFVHYRRYDDPIPRADSAGDWVEFCQAWAARGVPAYRAKKAVPLWGPCEIRDGGKRCNADVAEVTMCVADLDHCSKKKRRSLFAFLRGLGVPFLAHTTYTRLRWRVIVLLHKPCPGHQWSEVFPVLHGFLGLGEVADEKCSDPARQYYLPSCPDDGSFKGKLIWADGEPLDWEAIAGVQVEAAPQPKQITQRAVAGTLADLTQDEISKLAANKRKSKDPRISKLGDMLRSVAMGAAFAGEGERNDAAWRVVCALLNEFPRATPEQIVRAMAPSLDLMGRDGKGAVTESDVLAMAERKAAQSDHEYSLAAAKDFQLAWGSARTTPATEAEIEQTANTLGVSKEQLPHVLLIVGQVGEQYALSPRTCSYEPMPKDKAEDFTRQIIRPLAAALDVPLETSKGQFAKDSLRKSNTLTCRTISWALGTHASRVDFFGKRVTLACCPPRDIAPEYSEAVNHWLELLGGDEIDTLLDWIALCPDFSQPLPMLFLADASQAGKSLFFKGLSRLWGVDGPVDGQTVMHGREFKGDLKKNPIILCDEDIPRDYQGRPCTAELRSILTTSSRRVRGPWETPVDLVGYSRVGLAANSVDAITLGNASKDDLKAIANRIVCIRVKHAATEWLNRCDPMSNGWIANDVIPAHLRWIQENRQTVRSGPFGVSTATGAELVGKLAVQSDRADVVLTAVLELLAEHLGRVVNGQVRVDVAAVQDRVSILPTPLRKALTASNVTTQLRALGVVKGTQARIPMSVLEDHADATRSGKLEEIVNGKNE